MNARLALTRAEVGILLALAVWAALPVVWLLLVKAEPGDYFTGADGLYPPDQLQYLAWIREAGEGLLIGNQFDIAPSTEVFLHPMFALSGLAWKLGASIQLSYLLWKPVAVAVLFFGFRVYVRRLIDPQGPAYVAGLLLALFHVMPLTVIIGWGNFGGLGLEGQASVLGLEMSPIALLWGYLPTTVVLGLMAFYLLGLERLLDPDRRCEGRGGLWYGGWTALAGGLVSWLHPWQGLVLLGVTVGVVVLRGLPWKSRVAALPLGVTAVPVVYFFILSRTDPAWAVAAVQSDPGALITPLWMLVAGLVPLALPALLAARRDAYDIQEIALRLWVPVALAGYFLAPGYRLHMLIGLSLPLAILAVRGWQRLRLPATLGAVAILPLTLPGVLYMADYSRDLTYAWDGQAQLIEDSERRALRYLEEAPGEGGVIATYYLGPATPAFSGRPTWLGHSVWTPDFAERAEDVNGLFAGRLSPESAEHLARISGARFVLASCRDNPEVLKAALADLASDVRRFGCATVYELDVPGGTLP